MKRMPAALLLLLLLAPLAAQDKKPVDLAVGYPSTTLIYATGSVEQLGDFTEIEEALQGISGDVKLPDIRTLVAEKLELELTKQELRDLAAGTRTASAAVLDIAVKGPKLQVIFEHKDLAALARALAKAAKAGKETVIGSEEYDGVPIYQLYFPMNTGPSEGMLNELNPFRGWLDSLDIHAAVLENRYLVLAASSSACKDAIDGLLFPEDPADTLLGNKRYQEALKDFDKPAALLFVNVQAVINTMERLSGDQGSSPILDMMLRGLIPSGTDSAFWASLTQYEQFKSFSAAMWLPQGEGAVQGRIDARLSFHNTPGWLDALRVPAKPMPFLDLMPEDTISANTTCIDDFNKLYDQCKTFFVSRAKEAGQTEIIKQWDDFEKQLADEGHNHREFLKHLGLGQAWLAIPTSDDPDKRGSNSVGSVGLVGVNDWKAAQEYFYEKVLPGILGKDVREMESELSPVEVIGGVEIHSASSNRASYAFIPLPGGDGKQGVFVIGDSAGVRRLATMRLKKRTLANSAAFAQARAGMWETQNVGLYLNVGAVLQIMADTFDRYSRWDWDDFGEESAPDRDDAEKDRNPVPKLADFFSRAAIVGGTRSSETMIEMRFAAAGIPQMPEFKQLAGHYRDVARNFEVRDDLLRMREAAVAHLVLKDGPAADAAKLVESGCLAKADWSIDPYGKAGDVESTRKYELAVIPKDADIRQGILLAFQAKPGLRNMHLCVLWNNHIVALTPEQLAKAIERAAKGEALDEAAYATPLKPLFEVRPVVEDEWEDEMIEPKVEVAVIDDDGEETVIEVPPGAVATETEKILNTPSGPEDEDEE